MTLILVRHSHAGVRSTWTGDDRDRPLSDRGQVQSDQLVSLIAPYEPSALVTSPALRCVQTLEPLAAHIGADIATDDRLFERPNRDTIEALVHSLRGGNVVACTHGDVIPVILRALLTAGMTTKDPLRWQKGSTWIVHRKGKTWTKGHYFPPTDRPASPVKA